MHIFGRNLRRALHAEFRPTPYMRTFGRHLHRMLRAEFRTKSSHNSACRISDEISAESCLQNSRQTLSPEFYIHNFGQNFGRNLRIMLRAEFWPKCQQIYGPNLHIILSAEFRQKSLICRTMHAEFRLKSPHNAACTIRSFFAEVCIHNFSQNLHTILHA